MPKGHYNREGFNAQTWEPEWIDYLRELVAASKSYAEIADAFAVKYPFRTWTRNAVLGKAQRLGLTHPNRKTAPPKGRAPMSEKSRAHKKQYMRAYHAERKTANSTAATSGVLRDEHTGTGSLAVPRTRTSKAEMANRRLGAVPDVADTGVTSSKPMLETSLSECKWPTCDDPRSMDVCGAPATCGSYCDHHALRAYRVMPTRRRHAIMHAEQLEHERRLPFPGHGGGDVLAIAPPAPLLDAQDVPAIDEIPDDPVLMIPRFLAPDAT